MKVTIIKNDSVVLVDGRAIKVDLSDFPANVHAVQFDGANGHVEYNDGKANTTLKNLETFQTWVDRWTALRDAEDAPPPPDPPEVVKEKQRKAIDKQRDAALTAGCLFNGVLYPFDDVMVSAILGRLVLWAEGVIPIDSKLPVRLVNNGIAMLDRDRHRELAEALRAHGEAIYGASWAAKDAL